MGTDEADQANVQIVEKAFHREMLMLLTAIPPFLQEFGIKMTMVKVDQHTYERSFRYG